MSTKLTTMQDQGLQLGLPGLWTPTAWIAPEGLAFEDWEALGPSLKGMEGAVHWWIGDWLNYGERKWGEMYAQAMDETDYANVTLRKDAWVAGAVDLYRRRYKLTWSHHQEVARLSPNEQDYWLDRAEAGNGELDKDGNLIPWRRAELRRQMAKARTPDLPTEGKYRVFYADPPWPYTQKIDKYGPAERHYPLMPVEEICDLGQEIQGLTEDDAVLFLWTTAPFLERAFEVVQAWGFEYKTCFVWDKVQHNFGHYSSVRHELLLLATRGSCVPDADKKFDSVLTLDRGTEHSEKPEEFRQMIEALYTQGNRIELFARIGAPGWERWGYEAG